MDIRSYEQDFRYKTRFALNRIGLRKKTKVFAIGFNKSGTTSLHALFKSFGLVSHHGTRWRDCNDLALLRSYDCFSDDTPRDLAKLDRLFPGSRFILQVRELDSWVYSRLAHIERRKKLGQYKPNPLWDTTEYSIRQWIMRRNAYHLFVLSYFSGRPADLLVVNFIRDDLAAAKIGAFLGYERAAEKPAKNANPHKDYPPEQQRLLRSSALTLSLSDKELRYDLLCPSLLNGKQLGRFPVDTRMLGGYSYNPATVL